MMKFFQNITLLFIFQTIHLGALKKGGSVMTIAQKEGGVNYHEFDRNYLNELVTRPGSGVFKEEFDYHLALHPAQLNDIAHSIKGELNKKIARYDATFKGILLGFEGLRLLSQLGSIGLDNLYIHLDVRASFFVFRPEIGMSLKGTVTQTTQDHVGCLVYHTFNISLPKPVDDPNKTWLGYNAVPTNEVEFKITFVELNGRLPYIRGELLSILLSSEETPKKKSKKTKKTKNSDLDVSLDSLDLNTLFSNGNVDFDQVAKTETPGKVKRKKSKSFSLEEIQLEADSDLEKILK